MEGKALFKRTTAFALAALFVLNPSQQFSLFGQTVRAAARAITPPKIEFNERIGFGSSQGTDYKSTTNTYVVAGYGVEIKSELPAGYSYKTTQPYNFTWDGSATNDGTSQNLTGSVSYPHISVKSPLTAEGHAPSAEGLLTYTVAPNLQMNTAEGTGKFTYFTPKDSGPPEPGENYLTVNRVNGQLSVTEYSYFEFTTAFGQTDDGRIVFGNVSGAGGQWRNWVGASVTARNIQSGSLTVDIQHAGTTETFDIKFDTPMKVPAGATFKIEYGFSNTTQLTLTAVPPSAAREHVSKNMDATLSGPSETGKKVPYFEFAVPGDNQFGVTGNFKLLQQFYKYNAPMEITWSLKDNTDAQYVKILPSRGSDQINVQVDSTISENDHEVVLVAKIQLLGNTAANEVLEKEIPIVILGSGDSPKVEAAKSYNGIFKNGRQEIITQPITNNEFPGLMEVYDGSIPHVAPEAEQLSWPPFKVETLLHFGAGQRRASHVVISATGDGQLRLFQGASNTGSLVTTQGVRIQNDSTGLLPQITKVTFAGEKKGSVNLKIQFYKDANEIRPVYTKTIEIKDHSPKTTADLGLLELRGVVDPNATDDQKQAFREVYGTTGKIEYGFETGKNSYNIFVPDVAYRVALKPMYDQASLSEFFDQKLTILVNGRDIGIQQVSHGDLSDEIDLAKNAKTLIEITGIAENGTRKTYVLNIERMSPSTDNSLQKITVTPLTGEDRTPTEILPQVGITRYSLEVPHDVERVNVKAIANGNWGARPVITSDGPQRNALVRLFENASNKDIILNYDDTDPFDIKNVTIVTIEVQAEDTETAAAVYTLSITRKKPEDDRKLADKGMTIYLDKATDPLKLTKDFTGQLETFGNIPYKTNTVRLELLPNSEKAKQIRVEASVGGSPSQTKKYLNKGSPLIFQFSGLTPDPTQRTITFTIYVMAESGLETDPPYVLTLERMDPYDKTYPKSMSLVKQPSNQPASFVYKRDIYDYEVQVDYQTEAVDLTVEAMDWEGQTILVNGQKIAKDNAKRTIKLNTNASSSASSTVTPITVECTAENGEKATYTIKVYRKSPSREARLKNIVVNGGQDQKPDPFDHTKAVHTWSVPKGTRGFTITPTAFDGDDVTIKVDGQAVASGAPSQQIITSGPFTTVLVEVTAQDKVTKKTYKVMITDYNFIEKSDNAMLASMTTNYGQLAPKFNRTALDYEVYVKPDAMSLGIVPTPVNSRAKLEVQSDGRAISEYNGMYTASMLGDEMTFTVTVTAEAGNKQVYTLYVYKNDEEKMGIFNPITPEMVDFESSDPIVVDIAKYPVVDAGVFNTMKTEYPDKTILFKGNDYTLEMKGSDLDTLVPHTATYDLNLLLSPPSKEKIRDLMYDMDSRNQRIEPVFMHFDHKGTLPAPMKLTMSLGKAYSNKRLYIQYYNEDRDRIDYYGYVTANAKGTFSIPVDHLGTFLVTTSKIMGAENKSGLDYSSTPWLEEIGAEEESGRIKYNPETGAGGPR